jgi:2-hydroxymuconate-semialdehyde hydrolase
MLGGLRAATRTVDVDGVSTAVIEAGDGPPLLLLHGGVECGGPMWAPVLTGLARHHRVVAPDVPGLGQSAAVPRLDVGAFGRWLTGVAEHTGLERPTVVAHSLVGSLTTRYAAAGSPAIGRLIVYAAPGVGPYRMPLRLRYVAVRFAVRPTARNAERFDRFALLDLDATRQRDPDWYDAFETYTRSRARDPEVKRTMRRLVARETRPIPAAELDHIDIPTTLLWGRHDRMVPLPVGEAAASRHGWSLHVIDRAAHAPHIEQPEAFVDVLTAIMSAPEPERDPDHRGRGRVARSRGDRPDAQDSSRP